MSIQSLVQKGKIGNLELKVVLSKALEKQIPKKPLEDGYYDEVIKP